MFYVNNMAVYICSEIIFTRVKNGSNFFFPTYLLICFRFHYFSNKNSYQNIYGVDQPTIRLLFTTDR